MADLELEEVAVSLGGRPVLAGVSLGVSRGELVALLGPNGAGKTTALRAALGLAARSAGRVRLGGEDPQLMPPLWRARRAAYLPQQRPLAWPLRVRDVVALGRFAYGASPGRLGTADAEAVHGALRACDLEALAGRRADTLSGGELSRVHVARAIAGAAPLLLADEPIAALDPLHQVQVMRLLRAYVDAGNAALVVLHDAALAARFCQRLAWLSDGRVVADGPAAETLTRERFAEVYGVEAVVQRLEGHWMVAASEPAQGTP
jgi:iron complex transport system ATP-binding protein